MFINIFCACLVVLIPVMAAVMLLWSLLSAKIFVVLFRQKCCDLSLFNRGIDGSYVCNNSGHNKLFVTYMPVIRRCGHTSAVLRRRSYSRSCVVYYNNHTATFKIELIALHGNISLHPDPVRPLSVLWNSWIRYLAKPRGSFWHSMMCYKSLIRQVHIYMQ